MKPFENVPVDNWISVTDHLIELFPLNMCSIIQVVTCSWERLWNTNIGDINISLPLEEIAPPATVIGYMLEKLIAKELSMQYPQYWRGGKASDEKDIVYINNDNFSFEIKTSGQRGIKIFGNRSYGQALQNEERAKKNKSGYYLTVNFYKTTLNLIRFGWIDAEDWHSQAASTGQMASLGKDVYQYKLRSLISNYSLKADVWLIDGISKKIEKELNELRIFTILDLLNSECLPLKYQKFKKEAFNIYGYLLQGSKKK